MGDPLHETLRLRAETDEARIDFIRTECGQDSVAALSRQQSFGYATVWPMEQNRKFYVTPNRILDADIIGDMGYYPAGSRPDSEVLRLGGLTQEPIKEPELRIVFKDPYQRSITLHGEEADTAWNNYRRAVDINGEGQNKE